MVVLSLVIAIAAFFGWNSLLQRIEHDVRLQAQKWNTTFSEYNESIEAAVRGLDEDNKTLLQKAQREIEKAKAELEARLHNATALVFGRLCREEGDFLHFNYARRDFLDKAIYFAANAHENLQRFDSPYRWSALNNLVFYRSLLGDPTYARATLRSAEELRDRCLQTQSKFYYLTTFIRAAGEFGAYALDPATTFQEASQALQTLLTHPEVGKREREEAIQYESWLSQAEQDWRAKKTQKS